ADLPVNLPEARTREAEDERNVSVTLGADGSIAVDDKVVDAAGLRASLAARLTERGNRDVLVVIRADSSTPFARVRALLAEARGAGARRLARATRQKVGTPSRPRTGVEPPATPPPRALRPPSQ